MSIAATLAVGLIGSIIQGYIGRQNALWANNQNYNQQYNLSELQQKQTLENFEKLGVGAQAEQLRKHNLSVSMMYGKGGTGGANVQAPMPPSVNTQLNPLGSLDLLSAINNTMLAKSQAGLMDEEKESLEIENRYKDQKEQIDLLLSNADLEYKNLNNEEKKFVVEVAEVNAYIAKETKNEKVLITQNDVVIGNNTAKRLAHLAEIAEKENNNWDEKFKNEMNLQTSQAVKNYADYTLATANSVLSMANAALANETTKLTERQREKVEVEIKKLGAELKLLDKDLDFYTTDKIMGYVTNILNAAGNVLKGIGEIVPL